MGVPEDSLLRDPGQIPYSAPLPPSQTQADAVDEEETASLRELVQAIEAHVDLEVSSNLQATDNEQAQQQWTEDTPNQPIGEVAQPPPADPTIWHLRLNSPFVYARFFFFFFSFYGLPRVTRLWWPNNGFNFNLIYFRTYFPMVTGLWWPNNDLI